MYIYRLFNNDWSLQFNCSPYKQYPKTALTVKGWAQKDGCDLTMNLAYFNFKTASTTAAQADYRTLQFLRIMKLGGDCAYGGTSERITLPNGDIVAGWTLGILNGVVKETDVGSKRTRNGLGVLQDGTFFNVQTSHVVTIKAFCQAINTKYKPRIFLMMDGGGSTSCYSKRAGIYFCPEGQRAIPSVLEATYHGPGVSRTLKVGCKGDDVKLLQQLLGSVEVDGIFGTGSKSAVKFAQQYLFPKDKKEWDGIAGPKTLKALGIYKE